MKNSNQFSKQIANTISLLFVALFTTALAYSQAPDTWTQKANFGGTGRYGAVAFSINGKGYLGCKESTLGNFPTISFQIYTNPAEDHATIQCTLPQSSYVYIKVYDVSGKEIETLLDEDVEQGEHSLLLNTDHFSKGVYLVKMISDFGMMNQKLIV